MNSINERSKFKSLTEFFLANSSMTDKGVTFISGEKQEKFVSYKELNDKALWVLYELQSRGIEKGSQLILQVDDNEYFIYIIWACILGGILAAPVSVGSNDEHRMKLFNIYSILDKPKLITSKKISDSLQKFSQKNNLSDDFELVSRNTILIEELNAGDFEGTIIHPDPRDTAVIQFSSGSTGTPKGVIITHENALVNTLSCNIHMKTTSEDSSLSWLPLTHDLGLVDVHFCGVVAGINQYIMPTSLFIRHPLVWMKKVHEHRATQLYSPNFGYKHFLTEFDRNPSQILDLSCIRFIQNGAEPISVELCNTFLDKLAPYGLKSSTMCPVYGMAEATVGVTGSPVGSDLLVHRLNRECLEVGYAVQDCGEEDSRSIVFVDVGHAIVNSYVRICDDSDCVLEENILGNIQISGRNVTQGYYNNKEATDKAFTTDGWLRTGDLGFMRNGRLVITGRAKDIIFVNGQNYYPHDIERIAEDIEGIELGKIAACGVFNKETQKEEIVLFVIFKSSLEEFLPIATKLKRHINIKIGLEIKDVVPLRKIPKTTSGKVQRYKLGQSYADGEYSEVLQKIADMMGIDSIAAGENVPKDQIDEKLLEIWTEVLEVEKERIGFDDSFFGLGGNSLRATILASKVQAEFDVEIPIGEIFNLSVFKDLANFIRESTQKSFMSIMPAEEKEYYSVSSAQKRMFILHQLEGIGTSYNIPIAFKVEGNLDIPKFEEAFGTIINRHEALRTSFEVVNGEAVQKIHKDVEFKLSCIDCEESKVNGVIQEFIRPFDLSKAPLLRGAVLKLADSKHMILLDMHHIIADGTGVKAMLKEFSELYNGHSVTDITFQYKDFSEWQNSIFETEAMKKQEQYWLDIFSEEPSVLSMPLDYKRPDRRTFNGRMVEFHLSDEIIAKARALTEQQGVTMNMLMYAAYTLLISKYSGQDDIVIGSLVAGRNNPDIENTLGVFINFLPVRNKLPIKSTFLEFLNLTSDRLLSAYENQDYPFEKIVEGVNYNLAPSRNPLFDTLLNYHNEIYMDMNLSIDGLQSSIYNIECDRSTLDLKLDIVEYSTGKLGGVLEYNTNLLSEGTITRFIKHFESILELITDNPHKRLADINVFTQEEAAEVEAKRTLNSEKAEDKLKVAVSATFTAEPVREHLEWWCKQFNVDTMVEFAPYNQVFQQLLESDSLISTNTGINLLLVRFEDFIREDNSTDDEKCKSLEASFEQLVSILQDKAKSVPYFIGTFPISTHLSMSKKVLNFLEDINSRWIRSLQDIDGVYVINFAEAVQLYSVNKIFDEIKDRVGHQPFSDEYYAVIGAVAARNICSLKNNRFKVIVLDCDNTLWKGICGEDGALGVTVDEPYRILQEFMLEKQKDGMLLALCSKNNEADVFEVLEKNHGMVLKKEHLAAWGINWQDKAENLKELARELSLGLDSFIYVDDSPVECAKVMTDCPEVLTLKLPDDARQIPLFLDHVWAFDRINVTEEDKVRTEMYTAERNRREDRKGKISLDEFLKGLDIKVSMNPADRKQVSRVAQLTQRTNQFNSGSIRRSDEDVKELLSAKDTRCWVIEAADRFGEYGLVGAVIGSVNGSRLLLDTFLLSCRILGRNVEEAVLCGLKRYCIENSIDFIEIKYKPTSRNKPFNDFLEKTGWVCHSEKEDWVDYIMPVDKIADNAEFIDFYYNSVYVKSYEEKKTEDKERFIVSKRKQGSEGISPIENNWEVYCFNDNNLIHARYLLPLSNSSAGKLMELPVYESLDNLTSSGEYEAPCNDIETKLAEVWSAVLGIKNPGMNDRFFESGGDSLKVVRLISQIYDKFGVNIPFNELHRQHTLRGIGHKIASLLSGKEANKVEYPAMLLNDRKEKNIFAFPPMLGHGVAYSKIASSFNDYSFYSFDYLKDNNRIGIYADLITKIQNEGPYVLLGYSSGGKLAFEVAKELLSRGFKVSGLIIVDTKNVRSNKAAYHALDYSEANCEVSAAIEAEIGKQGLNGEPRKLSALVDEQKQLIKYVGKGFKTALGALNKKSMSYISYTSSGVKSSERIESDIYLVKSPWTADGKVDKWGGLTEKSFKKYTGFGRHGEMIEADNAEKNALVVKGILQEIEGRKTQHC
ncbi:MAG: HAD-IIIC family phosphatase [Clostridia bacterium]|nr:HAD-IIIC family phosphatase [Clostridia bacterium]